MTEYILNYIYYYTKRCKIYEPILYEKYIKHWLSDF